jgi:hypothetical protein
LLCWVTLAYVAVMPCSFIFRPFSNTC